MADPALTLESLESLLELSKTPQGRSFLASKSLVPSLLLHLPSLPHLRLLRNLCAAEPAILLSFLRCDGHRVIASLVLSPSSPAAVSKIALQVLANAAGGGGEDHASAVWAHMFPRGFIQVLGVGDSGIVDAVCMIMYTCCFAASSPKIPGVEGRRREICDAASGVEVVAAVVRGALAVGYRGDWLQLLLSRSCFEQTCFRQLFLELGLSDFSGNSMDLEFCKTDCTVEQVFLLEFLSDILEECPYDGIICSNFASSILHILKNASDLVDFSIRGLSPLPTGSPLVDAIGFSLTILKDVCALDFSSLPSLENPINSLLSSGMCQFLLGLLRDLEPPPIIRRSVSYGQSQGLPSPVIITSKFCLYEGFRRDIVAVIGNCLFGRKDVQDEIRRQNGILLLLQQCVVDEENPFLREWGIWAVRCLLDGNLENQKEVADLEIQGSATSPEITELGLRVEIDQKSHRAKLVNIP